MPYNKPSKCIVCPECNSRIFDRAFIPHLMTAHGMDLTMAQAIRARAKWPERDNRGYYGAARIVPAEPVTAPVVQSQPQIDLESLSREQLLALIKGGQG